MLDRLVTSHKFLLRLSGFKPRATGRTFHLVADALIFDGVI